MAAIVAIGAPPAADEAVSEAPLAALDAPDETLEAALLADSDADETALDADSETDEAASEAEDMAEEAPADMLLITEDAASLALERPLAAELAAPVIVLVITLPPDWVICVMTPKMVGPVGETRVVNVLPSVVMVEETPSVKIAELVAAPAAPLTLAEASELALEALERAEETAAVAGRDEPEAEPAEATAPQYCTT